MFNTIAKRTLHEYWEKHPDCEKALSRWWEIVKTANWENANDLKADIGGASVVGNRRIVFNIRGNKYRLIAKFDFEY